jgi:hypothetical protein
MQIDKKLKQSLWIVLAMPFRGAAIDHDREEIRASPAPIRNSLEAIEKTIEY